MADGRKGGDLGKGRDPKKDTDPTSSRALVRVFGDDSVSKTTSFYKVVEKMATKTDKDALVFKAGDHIVYPAHGVGRVTGVEVQTVAGHKLEVYVIQFDQDKMTLRVPTARAKASGMRPLSSTKIIDDALKTLTGRARIKRTMWSRRAQEYEAKINSGNIIEIAEVVRDLHRAGDQPEQSYSERQLYESALDRLAREVAAVDGCDQETARKRLAASLAKKAA